MWQYSYLGISPKKRHCLFVRYYGYCISIYDVLQIKCISLGIGRHKIHKCTYCNECFTKKSCWQSPFWMLAVCLKQAAFAPLVHLLHPLPTSSAPERSNLIHLLCLSPSHVSETSWETYLYHRATHTPAIFGPDSGLSWKITQHMVVVKVVKVVNENNSVCVSNAKTCLVS